MSLEEVDVRAGHKVLIEANDNILLIAGDPQRILDHQLWPHPKSYFKDSRNNYINN
jgi:hypothetical protein